MNGLSEWFSLNPWIAWPIAVGITVLFEYFIYRYFFRNHFQSVLNYLKAFVREEFKWQYVLAIVCLISIGIYGYYGMLDLRQMKWELRGTYSQFLFYFILYASPFALAYFLYPVLRIPAPFLRNYRFWLLLVVAVSIFTLRSSASIWTTAIYENYANSGNPEYWTRIIALVAIRAPTILGLVFIVWFLIDKKKMPFYGFTMKGFDLKPYIGMLCFMIPLVMMAALTGDFLDSYPRGNGWGLEQYSVHEAGDWKYLGLFELVYGLDFINIELFFRGFLILAFLKFGGPKVILPAAAFYVFIHFGKPLGETISSFFGGTLLGIIAYYSRSILGGIIIHMGIAWLMELTAFISLLYL